MCSLSFSALLFFHALHLPRIALSSKVLKHVFASCCVSQGIWALNSHPVRRPRHLISKEKDMMSSLEPKEELKKDEKYIEITLPKDLTLASLPWVLFTSAEKRSLGLKAPTEAWL